MLTLAMIQSLIELESPRERCLKHGPGCLSIRECLAILLESGPLDTVCMGLAFQILTYPGQGLGSKDQERAFFVAMENSVPSFLKDCPGLGPVGQAKLLAAFEIGRRYAQFRWEHQLPNRNKNRSLSRIQKQVLEKVSVELRLDSREWFGFIAIYRTGELSDLCLVERGTRTHVNFDPADLFSRILALRPLGYYLLHNHPSGNPAPSLQDFELTHKVEAISKEFQIQLLGHWVVGAQGEYWIDPNVD